MLIEVLGCSAQGLPADASEEHAVRAFGQTRVGAAYTRGGKRLASAPYPRAHTLPSTSSTNRLTHP